MWKLLIGGTLALAAGAADATIIDVTARGTVGPGELAREGDPFTVSFSYDDAVAPLTAETSADGSYHAIYGTALNEYPERSSPFFTALPTIGTVDDTFRTDAAQLELSSYYYYGQYRTFYSITSDYYDTDGLLFAPGLEIEIYDGPGVTRGLPDTVSLATAYASGNFRSTGPADGSYIGDDGLPVTTGTQTFFNYGPATLSVAPAAAAVPEPASWALAVAGFGLVGRAMRRRRAGPTPAAAR